MQVLSKNNKVLLADGQAVKWQSGGDTPLKVLTHNNKLLLADGKALRNLKLPATYTELPYLVATDASKAWIDTGIPYQNGCKIELQAANITTANLFGVFYTAARCRGYWASNNNLATFNIGIDASNAIFNGLSDIGTGVHKWVMVSNPNTNTTSITIGDKSYIYNQNPVDRLSFDTSPYTIYLFTVHRAAEIANNGTRVIHYFKYWDNNGNLLLDLVPVQRNSDGVLGMLNKVNGRFLTNISTGTFYKEVPASADEEIDDMEIV